MNLQDHLLNPVSFGQMTMMILMTLITLNPDDHDDPDDHDKSYLEERTFVVMCKTRANC